MKLLALQRRMAADLFQPLGPGDKIARGARANGYIKPNDRLTSNERLEIYSRSYWFRVIDALYDDFPGLRAVLGQRAFDRAVRGYLAQNPSRSFTLRNLGSRLEIWLRDHSEFAGACPALALDMTRLEWAHIEAFDGAAEKPLGPEDLLELGPAMRMGLQPYIRLLELQYPVDDLRIHVARVSEEHGIASNLALHRHRGVVRRVGKMNPEKIFLAVHRLDFTVYYRRLTAEGFRLLKALRAGRPIGQAVDASIKGSSIPLGELQSRFETWFAAWAELGWFCLPRQK
jgi:hypothetical protein